MTTPHTPQEPEKRKVEYCDCGWTNSHNGEALDEHNWAEHNNYPFDILSEPPTVRFNSQGKPNVNQSSTDSAETYPTVKPDHTERCWDGDKGQPCDCWCHATPSTQEANGELEIQTVPGRSIGPGDDVVVSAEELLAWHNQGIAAVLERVKVDGAFVREFESGTGRVELAVKMEAIDAEIKRLKGDK